jgi:hypothetical protein
MNNTIFWVTTPYSLVETYVLDKCSSMCLWNVCSLQQIT